MNAYINQRIKELDERIAKAPIWGAAVTAMVEEREGLKRQLAASPGKIREGFVIAIGMFVISPVLALAAVSWLFGAIADLLDCAVRNRSWSNWLLDRAEAFAKRCGVDL